MRPIVLTLAVLVVSASLVGEEQKTVRHATSEKLKESFHVSPESALVSHDDESAPAIVLERLTITDSFKRRQLEQSIREHDDRAKKERFSLKDGGTIAFKDFGKVRAEIGIWGESGPFSFLRLRW